MIELGGVTRLTRQNDVFNHMLTALREWYNVVDCCGEFGAKRSMTVSAVRLTGEQVQQVLCRYVAIALSGAPSMRLRPEYEFAAQSTAKACSASQIVGLVLGVVALMTFPLFLFVGFTVCDALLTGLLFVASVVVTGKQLVTLAAFRGAASRLSLVDWEVLIGLFDVAFGTFFAWHTKHDTPSCTTCQV